MKTVATKNAPAALGPYAQAQVSGGFVFTSGQIGIDPATGAMCRDIQWRCQYEDALIQPVRPVLDVCPGPFAAGQRG